MGSTINDQTVQYNRPPTIDDQNHPFHRIEPGWLWSSNRFHQLTRSSYRQSDRSLSHLILEHRTVVKVGHTERYRPIMQTNSPLLSPGILVISLTLWAFFLNIAKETVYFLHMWLVLWNLSSFSLSEETSSGISYLFGCENCKNWI